MTEQIKTKQAEHLEKAEELIKSIGIPSQPRIVLEINREINQREPDLEHIVELVEKDVAMSARVMKTANSPFFSTRPSDSIEEALFTIGLSNFYNLVLTAALQDSMDRYGADKHINEKFWKHSSVVARVSRHIAKKAHSPLADNAYMAGLFHDCAIPVLVKRYPAYAEIMDMAMGSVPLEALRGAYRSVIGMEDERYSTNHCIVGYLIAKSWLLSENIVEAICYHHYIHLDIHKNPAIEQLVSILLLSEYITQDYSALSVHTGDDVREWAMLHEKPLTALGMDAGDLADIREDIHDVLSQDNNS